MPKPRKFIRVLKQQDGSFTLATRKDEGIEIPGLSYHARTHRLYRVLAPGQRQYVGYDRDLTSIVRRHLGLAEKSFEVEKDEPRLAWSYSTKWIDQNPNSIPARVTANIDRRRKGLDPLPMPGEKPQAALSKQTVRSCLNEWKTIKREEGVTSDYIGEIKTVTNRFIKVVGNKPISELTADDFATWRRHITIAAKKFTAHWHNENHKHLRTMFTEVRRAKPSWDFPAGLTDWLSGWKSQKHLVRKENRAAMPVDVFHRLVVVAESWASVNPDDFPKDTQRDKARRKKAYAKRLEGLAWVAILKLAVNCSLDCVDCQRIQWIHLIRLGGKLPYMNFGRSKVSKKIGGEVERKTPLLPSTVAALIALREVNPYDGYVFRTERKGPYSERAFQGGMRRLRNLANVDGFTFKHIRNVGPTVGRNNKRPIDEREAILGHVIEGNSKFYTGEFDESFLVELVNLIGRDYFGGETVNV